MDGTYDSMEQQTRRFDEESGTTIYMRSKVDAIDYKYFIEPNIPKFKLTEEFLDSIRKSIPLLAREKKEKYISEYGLSNYDATILVKERSISEYFDAIVEQNVDPKISSNWVTSVILGYLNKNSLEINEIFVTPKMLAELINLVSSGKISIKQGKEVLFDSLEKNIEPKKIVEEKGISQIGNEDEIRKIVISVLDNNQDNIEKYKSGRTNVLDYLVGQVMKETRGKANPAITRKLMQEEIERR